MRAATLPRPARLLPPFTRAWCAWVQGSGLSALSWPPAINCLLRMSREGTRHFRAATLPQVQYGYSRRLPTLGVRGFRFQASQLSAGSQPDNACFGCDGREPLTCVQLRFPKSGTVTPAFTRASCAWVQSSGFSALSWPPARHCLLWLRREGTRHLRPATLPQV